MITPELMLKIKESMIEHLKTHGYPDMSRDAILSQVPAMWDKLNSEGLLEEPIKQGFTFDHFYAIANQRKMDFDTMEEVARFFRRGP